MFGIFNICSGVDTCNCRQLENACPFLSPWALVNRRVACPDHTYDFDCCRSTELVIGFWYYVEDENIIKCVAILFIFMSLFFLLFFFFFSFFFTINTIYIISMWTFPLQFLFIYRISKVDKGGKRGELAKRKWKLMRRKFGSTRRKWKLTIVDRDRLKFSHSVINMLYISFCQWKVDLVHILKN